MTRLSWKDYIDASDKGREAWLSDFRSFEGNTQVESLSTRIEDYGTHLLIRQGQRSSAVVTLPTELHDLPLDAYDDMRKLLSISFNTLCDWHIILGNNCLHVFNNRISERQLHRRQVTLDELPPQALGEHLGVAEEYIVVPDYDDVSDRLLSSIEMLKRTLTGDPNSPRVGTKAEIDDILNAVIFLRFLEDHDLACGLGRIDIKQLIKSGAVTTFSELVRNVFRDLGLPMETKLFNFRRLTRISPDIDRMVFDWIPSSYRDTKQGRYEYDLNLIAGYSIGQIYEKYIALVSYYAENGNISLFPEYETVLRWQRGTGALYTPEYLAQFMVGQALKDINEEDWANLAVGDFACGSGVFLRHFLLNIQSRKEITGGITKQLLGRLYGNDIIPSAVAAARLSIAMTTYACQGSLTEGFSPTTADALSDSKIRQGRKRLDIILMNPPFKGYDQQSAQEQRLSRTILGGLGHGKVDISSVFLFLAFNNLKPNGILSILLPAAFLEAEYSSHIRQYLVNNSQIKFVGKFEEYGIFPRGETQIALLILQKRENVSTCYPTRVLYCRKTLDLALRAVQIEKYQSKFEWEFFRADSSTWNSKWNLIPKELGSVLNRLEIAHPALGQIFKIRQGIRIGRKSAFIIEDVSAFPRAEHDILMPVADDENLYGWQIHSDRRRLIYAYKDGKPLKATVMKSKYPKILAHLEKHRTHLEQRSSMANASIWELVRPRNAKDMSERKLVCCNFGLSGSYALDNDGKYAVTNGSILIPYHPFTDDDAWFFYLAILNSPLYMRIVARKSRRLKGGQYDFDQRFTRSIAIPNFELADKTDRKELAEIARRSHHHGFDPNIQSKLDSLIANVYQLDLVELSLI
ncbi:MAG: N-6 DNA methylase [candidate division Zixibacteria bacterium]|nr:N-6 DNA methylase [candidate division Zixibacteria bacterium]